MQSLLDVILANSREEQISGAYLCRLAFVCSWKVKQTNADTAQVLLPQCDGITGLALVLPTCMAVLLEGNSQDLQHAVKSMQQQTLKAGGIIQAAKVLLSMEGVREQCSRSFFSAFVTSTFSMEAAEPADPAQVVHLSSSIVDSLGHIASSLSSLTEPEAYSRLLSLPSYHEDIPTADVVLALAASDQLITIDEWLDTQLATTAPDIVLDDEVAWPMPSLADVRQQCLC